MFVLIFAVVLGAFIYGLLLAASFVAIILQL
jgi:hypothetical protein